MTCGLFSKFWWDFISRLAARWGDFLVGAIPFVQVVESSKPTETTVALGEENTFFYIHTQLMLAKSTESFYYARWRDYLDIKFLSCVIL